MANKDISQVHDKYFKSLLSNKSSASEFIQKLLPKDISGRLQVDALALANTEYIDDELQKSFSDLVYNCIYRGDEQDVNVQVSLLFEHKSQPEKYPYRQLLRYMFDAMGKQLAQGEQLTPIIPVVFYHGAGKWQPRQMADDYPYLDSLLRRFIPLFEYLLVDTNKIDDRAFQALDDRSLELGLLLMKYIYHEEKLEQDFTRLFASARLIIRTVRGRQFFETFNIYLINSTTFDVETLEEKMKAISAEAGEQFVSTADRLIERGMSKGIEKGIAKGTESVAVSMLHEGMADDLILKLTKITADQLQRLKLQLDT